MSKKIIGMVVGLILVLASVHVFNLPFGSSMGRAVHPAGDWLQNAGSRIRSAAGELPRLGRFQTDIRRAESELTELRLQLVAHQRLEQQNTQLRSELEFAEEFEHELLAADIVNYQPIANRDSLRVAAGSDHGVKEGMPVVSQGALLGRIESVEDRYSQVLLVTDTDFRALVDIGQTSGVLRGQVGGGLLVERLERHKGIDEGDAVTTSSREGSLPADMLIGSVRSTREASDSIFDTANVSAEVDPRNLTVVMIVTNYE